MAALFAEDGDWRDLLCFTWNIATLEGRPAIERMLAATLSAAGPCRVAFASAAPAGDGEAEVWFDLETGAARADGVARIADGRCITLLTAMKELKGHEEPAGRARPLGVAHGADRRRETWLERRRREAEELGRERQPYCVVIGGGQGGIMLGARLEQLGVPTVILEKNPRAGDSWRNRYRSLVLHDPVWYDHLPYTSHSRRPGRCSAQGQDGRLARGLCADLRARCLDLDHLRGGAVGSRGRAVACRAARARRRRRA